MDKEDHPQMRIGSASDLLAAIPFLVGHHPSDSLLVMLVADGGGMVMMRCDVPDHASAVPALVDGFLERCSGVESADKLCFALGYGAATRVDAPLTAAVDALEAHGWSPGAVLRVERDRFWSLTCPDPACCPPEGRPFDNQSHEITATMVAEGRALPAPNRAAVADRVASRFVSGTPLATEGVVQRWTAEVEQEQDPDDVLRHLARRATSLAQMGLDLHRRGQRLSDEDAVELALAVTCVPVRDRVWISIETGPDLRLWLDLWCDLTRRLPPNLVTPCAALAGFCAWLSGDSVLAAAACERALAESPGYPMAALFQQAAAEGVPPSTWGPARRRMRSKLPDL